ncbi:MAG: OmpH family outer membrane protein [Candidatus Omnitrophica bacterium]|nr:OmpH family outer membrane protein [Candidatus Omnitrophota bacterium]
MKKLTFLLLAAFMACTLTTSLYAQEVKKIGYLDLSKVFDSYEKTKEFDSSLEGVYKEYDKERTTKIEQLKEAQGKMALLSDDEKEKVGKEVEQLKTDLVEYDRQKQTDLRKQRDEKIRELLLEIEKIVSDVAKKEKYDLILNDRVLIFGSDALDVTDKIIQILNEGYNKK